MFLWVPEAWDAAPEAFAQGTKDREDSKQVTLPAVPKVSAAARQGSTQRLQKVLCTAMELRKGEDILFGRTFSKVTHKSQSNFK